jgi:hypothetical protein
LLGLPRRARSFGRKGGRAVAESRDRKALAVLRRRVNSMVRAINPADAIRECCDDGAFRWKGRPSEAAGPVYARRIDVIVVYKVDRLTCALAEFAKLSSWSTRTALSSFR